MARTPLFRALVKLAREHQQAQRQATSLTEVREAESRSRERLHTRRGFLVGAAAATGTALLARSSARAAGAPARIAIVGGGLSGLSAALALVDAGLAPTVYEASHRFGGRMKSEGLAGKPGCGSCHDVARPASSTWADGQVTDLFGELIDTGHLTMQDLAARFGLPLIDLLASEPAGSTETYYFQGRHYPKADADRDYVAIGHALQRDLASAGFPTTWERSKPGGRALDAMSLYEWIETRVPGGHRSPLGLLLDTAYVIEFGAETTEQSALNLVYLLGYSPSRRVLTVFGASDERFRIGPGVETLPLAMARHLASRCTLQLGSELTSLALRPDGAYTLSFDGRAAAVADVVVLTTPFAVLRGIDLSRAGFDALKLKAIRELGYGHNGKLQLQFTRRLWNEVGPWGRSGGTSYADTGYQATWEATRGQPGASGILVNYTGGATTDALAIRHPYATIESAPVAADAARFLSRVEGVFPGLSALWNGRGAETRADLNRFWGGSYSFYRVGQYQAFGGYEAARQGNVFFAGEHTTQDFQGYMEGAALSGRNVGREIAALLRKRQAI